MCLDTVQDTTASMCSSLANRSICDHVLYHSADMRWVQRERVWWGWVHMHWLNSPTAPAGDCEMLTVDVSLCALMFPHTNNRPPYFCCLHTPVTPLLLCCFTSHLHESQPQGLTGHLSLCLSFSVSQPWNFTRTSTTWQRRRGWRAGSCIRRWRASHGTSQYWRWEQPWLSFVYLPVWRTSSYHIAGFVTSPQQTDKVKGQSWWANFLLKEFYHHCGHVTVLWKTCTKTVSNCNWSVFLWSWSAATVLYSHTETCFYFFYLQGQADLLKHAKIEVQENLRQIHCAVLTCNLSKHGAGTGTAGSESKSRHSLEAIPEKATAEEDLTGEEDWRPPAQPWPCTNQTSLLFLPPELWNPKLPILPISVSVLLSLHWYYYCLSRTHTHHIPSVHSCIPSTAATSQTFLPCNHQ